MNDFTSNLIVTLVEEVNHTFFSNRGSECFQWWLANQNSHLCFYVTLSPIVVFGENRNKSYPQPLSFKYILMSQRPFQRGLPLQ
jgi:hypothetical protein